MPEFHKANSTVQARTSSIASRRGCVVRSGVESSEVWADERKKQGTDVVWDPPTHTRDASDNCDERCKRVRLAVSGTSSATRARQCAAETLPIRYDTATRTASALTLHLTAAPGIPARGRLPAGAVVYYPSKYRGTEPTIFGPTL